MRKVLLVLVGLSFAAMPALAFHDAGVAHCNGCHTMHNSQDGNLVDPDSPAGNFWLLTDSTPSDVCLNCHADHLGSVLGDDPLAPPRLIGAGNFVFLLEDNLNDGHGGGDLNEDPITGDPIPGDWVNPIPGDAAGHNVNAPGHGLAADATLSTSPGGGFPASQLGCSSCHDPHGNTNFRMLYGAGPIQDNLTTFSQPAPIAVGGPSIFFGGGESQANHTAYNSGMSEWCGNCHGNFHASGNRIHPTGVTLTGAVAATYNLYNGTTDQTGGAQATAYLAEVPFEDAAATNDPNSTNGAGAGSYVMCMSCHRAHATSAPDAGRWDFSVTLLDEDGLESGSYPIPNPYADPDQRSLCNKCHRKDLNDHVTP